MRDECRSLANGLQCETTCAGVVAQLESLAAGMVTDTALDMCRVYHIQATGAPEKQRLFVAPEVLARSDDIRAMAVECRASDDATCADFCAGTAEQLEHWKNGKTRSQGGTRLAAESFRGMIESCELMHRRASPPR
jgi:hypothetical protein